MNLKVFDNPVSKIILSFLNMIIIGTFLLSFPVMRNYNFHYSFVDIFFTATSAVCVCGLDSINITDYFSIYGKIIIMLLVQLGGLGYMAIISFLIAFTKKRLSVNEKMASVIYIDTIKDIKSSALKILKITFFIEFLGALFLLVSFRNFNISYIFLAIFHSISAFCNAGFMILDNKSIINNHIFINTLSILIVLGGIGFIVIENLYSFFLKKEKISFHTKVVLFLTFILIIIPFIIFLSTEYNNSLKNYNLLKKITVSFFQVITTRTAGFSLLNINNYLNINILICIFLMFIGASPTGTGGGIKTTTFLILLKNFFATFLNKKNTFIFKRTIEENIIQKSINLFFFYIIISFLATFILLFTEKNVSIINIFFEVISALSTTGLTLGITEKLSIVGKIIIIILMFIGRVYILFVTSKVFINSQELNLKYPEGKILIG